jgi:hypothetical protein
MLAVSEVTAMLATVVVSGPVTGSKALPPPQPSINIVTAAKAATEKNLCMSHPGVKYQPVFLPTDQ